MTPCGVKWCVALTDEQFCVVHKAHRGLRPAEIGVLNRSEDEVHKAYEEGFAEGDTEGYERGLGEAHD